MSKEGCIYRKNPNGDDNPKYVDLLEEDKPIAGQKFCCVSFVSPEKILKNPDKLRTREFLSLMAHEKF